MSAAPVKSTVWKLDNLHGDMVKDLYDFIMSTVYGKMKQKLKSGWNVWYAVLKSVVRIENRFDNYKSVTGQPFIEKLFINQLETENGVKYGKDKEGTQVWLGLMLALVLE